MTKEEIESKAKEPFPNDEFKQQIVIDAINWAIAELEKENAELKKQLEMSNKVYNDNLDYSHHIEEQLTNAKELLKQWVQTSRASGCDNINIVTDTEQFLKDSEVEK